MVKPKPDIDIYHPHLRTVYNNQQQQSEDRVSSSNETIPSTNRINTSVTNFSKTSSISSVSGNDRTQYVVKKMTVNENSDIANQFIREAEVMYQLTCRCLQENNDHIIKFYNFIANEVSNNKSGNADNDDSDDEIVDDSNANNPEDNENDDNYHASDAEIFALMKQAAGESTNLSTQKTFQTTKSVRFSSHINTTPTTSNNSTLNSPIRKTIKYYLVMEFAKGSDLSRWMLNSFIHWKPQDNNHHTNNNNYRYTSATLPNTYLHLSEKRTQVIAWQTISALSIMHGDTTISSSTTLANGYIHRDIKPDNIFVKDSFASGLIDLEEMKDYNHHFNIYIRPTASQRRVNITDSIIYDKYDGLHKDDEYAPKDDDINNTINNPNLDTTLPHILLADFDRSKRFTNKQKNYRTTILSTLLTNTDSSRGKYEFLPPDYYAASDARLLDNFHLSCGADLFALALSLIIVHFTGLQCTIPSDKTQTPSIGLPKNFSKYFSDKLRTLLAPKASKLWKDEYERSHNKYKNRYNTNNEKLSTSENIGLTDTEMYRSTTMINEPGKEENEISTTLDDEERNNNLTSNISDSVHINKVRSSSSKHENSLPVHGKPFIVGFKYLKQLFEDYATSERVPMPTDDFIRFIRDLLTCDEWGTPVYTANKFLSHTYLSSFRPEVTGTAKGTIITATPRWDEFNDLPHAHHNTMHKTSSKPLEPAILFEEVYQLGNKELGKGFCTVHDAVRQNSKDIETKISNDKGKQLSLLERKCILSERYGPSPGATVAVKWYRRDLMLEQGAKHLDKSQLDRRIIDRYGKPLDNHHLATIYAIFQQAFYRAKHNTELVSNVAVNSAPSKQPTALTREGKEVLGHPSLLVVMKTAPGGPFDQWVLRRGRDIALLHKEALDNHSKVELDLFRTNKKPQLVNIYCGPRFVATIIGQVLRAVRYMHQEGRTQTDIRLYALLLGNTANELDNLPLECTAEYPEKRQDIEHHYSVKVRLELPESIAHIAKVLSNMFRRLRNKQDSTNIESISKTDLLTELSNDQLKNSPLYRITNTLVSSTDNGTEMENTNIKKFLPNDINFNTILPHILLSPVNVMKSNDAYTYREEFKMLNDAQKESPAIDIWAIGDLMKNMLQGYAIEGSNLSNQRIEENNQRRENLYRSMKEINSDTNEHKMQYTEDKYTYDPYTIIQKLQKYDSVIDGSSVDFITNTILADPWFQHFDCSYYEEIEEAIELRKRIRNTLGQSIAVDHNPNNGYILDACNDTTESELEHEILKTLGLVTKPDYLNTRNIPKVIKSIEDSTSSNVGSKTTPLPTSIYSTATLNILETESPAILLRVLVNERNSLEYIRWINRLLLWINVLWIFAAIGMLARKDYVDAWFVNHQGTSNFLNIINTFVQSLFSLSTSKVNNDYSGRAVFFMLILFSIKCYRYFIRTATSRAIDVLSGQISIHISTNLPLTTYSSIYKYNLGILSFLYSSMTDYPKLQYLYESTPVQFILHGVHELRDLLITYVCSTIMYRTLSSTDGINTVIVLSSDSLLLIGIYCLFLSIRCLILIPRNLLSYFWLPLDPQRWFTTLQKYSRLLIIYTVIPLGVLIATTLWNYIVYKKSLNLSFSPTASYTVKHLMLCTPWFENCLSHNALDDERIDFYLFLLMGCLSTCYLIYYSIYGSFIPIPLPRKVWK